MPFYYLDSTYFIYVLPAVILALYAQFKVSSTFNKYARVRSQKGVTGAQAAEILLKQSGIYDVKIEHVRGNLSDHYDPRSKTLRLSDSVYGSSSIAAIGVAAHETGHAVQHDRGYVPLNLRSAIVPIASLGSNLAVPLILLGVFLSFSAVYLGDVIIQLGIILFGMSVLFQLVTLPVEFNASNRAMVMAEDAGILLDNELKGAKKVLRAAALTYVASAAVALGNLLRFIVLFGGGRRRD